MSGQVLLDTNILVYAEDAREPLKRIRAQQVIESLVTAEIAVVTPQILGEYFHTVSRLFRTTLAQDAARSQVERYGELFDVVPATFTTVVEAARGAVRYKLRYYDAQIWAAARLGGVGVVLSEDFEDGREIEGVRFVDPFAEGFDAAALIG